MFRLFGATRFIWAPTERSRKFRKLRGNRTSAGDLPSIMATDLLNCLEERRGRRYTFPGRGPPVPHTNPVGKEATMLQTHDLLAVRRFAAEVTSRLAGCNGEGMQCQRLDDSLRCLAELCVQVWEETRRWAAEVFAGRVEFDPEVETLFKSQLETILTRAKPLVRHSKGMQFDCASLSYLPLLENYVTFFDQSLRNWVSPRRATGPAARTRIPESAAAEIRARLSGPTQVTTTG